MRTAYRCGSASTARSITQAGRFVMQTAARPDTHWCMQNNDQKKLLVENLKASKMFPKRTFYIFYYSFNKDMGRQQ
jgi:hypothetical protein